MKIAHLFSVQGCGVVVTGGASGLGLGYAEALAGNGALVTVKVIPMQRVGVPDDMHGPAQFLASPASAHLTGQEIQIDGGWGSVSPPGRPARAAGTCHIATSP
jgi:NAD(P)-dependent dehydrogenase (short-subunit alcohol dehydrogenase family)